MYDDLVKRLNVFRLKEDEYQIIPVYVSEIIGEAADVIEELSRENESLGKDLTSAVEMLKKKRKPKWIPVTERLPERNTWVLAYCKYKDHVVDYVDINGLWSYGNVTHWMPLPQPPEKESES